MSNICSKLIQAIDHKGAITVQEYMDHCLFDPEYGYYRTHHTPIGRTGDFTTAPEISQMFGEMIGLWVINLYEQFGEPNEIALVELGPGRGTLMSDLLRSMRLRPAMIKNLSIHLLEINLKYGTSKSKFLWSTSSNISAISRFRSAKLYTCVII